MRVESLDMTEFVRRMDREIYDRDEYTHVPSPWVQARTAPRDRRPQRTRGSSARGPTRTMTGSAVSQDVR